MQEKVPLMNNYNNSLVNSDNFNDDNDGNENISQSLLHASQVFQFKYGLKIITFILLILFSVLLVLLQYTSNDDIYSSQHKFLTNYLIDIQSNDSCIRHYGFYDHHCISSENIKQYDENNKTIYRISLNGDSLMSRPNWSYNLSSIILNKIQNTYPHLSFEVIVSSTPTYGIDHILEHLEKDCLAYHPHSTIIFGDSDKTIFKKYETNEIQNYRKLLTNVIGLLKENVSHIAIAGPTLNGELPDGQNAYDNELNRYRDDNKKVAKELNVSYIDVRKAFFDKEKDNNGVYGLRHGSHGQFGYLTVDGAHPSYLGNEIIVDMFYNQLKIWYQNYN